MKRNRRGRDSRDFTRNAETGRDGHENRQRRSIRCQPQVLAKIRGSRRPWTGKIGEAKGRASRSPRGADNDGIGTTNTTKAPTIVAVSVSTTNSERQVEVAAYARDGACTAHGHSRSLMAEGGWARGSPDGVVTEWRIGLTPVSSFREGRTWGTRRGRRQCRLQLVRGKTGQWFGI